MTTPVGGLRARFVRDSFAHKVRTALDELGWFTANPDVHQDVDFIDEPKDWDEPIEPNAIAMSTDTVDDEDAEMGSNLTDDRWTFYIDVYAEDDVIGTHIADDIRDVLRGKMPSAGADRPTLEVYDFSLATPAVFATCDIENVIKDQVRGAPKPWQRYWFTIRCDVIDTYGDEND